MMYPLKIVSLLPMLFMLHFTFSKRSEIISIGNQIINRLQEAVSPSLSHFWSQKDWKV